MSEVIERNERLERLRDRLCKEHLSNGISDEIRAERKNGINIGMSFAYHMFDEVSAIEEGLKKMIEKCFEDLGKKILKYITVIGCCLGVLNIMFAAIKFL